MGSWIAGQISTVKRHSGPCQPLHEGHWRIVVKVGFVIDMLLQDREQACRGRVPWLTCRDRRDPDRHAIAINDRPLVGEADDDQDRAGRGNIRCPQILPGLELLNRVNH